MNSQCFKNVFSKRLGCLVAVGEHASSHGKANGASAGHSVVLYVAQLTAACVLVSMAWAGPAGSVSPVALPSGGQLAQGVATVQQAGAVMNIHQSTSKAVMNWNSFDIGQNAKVNIVQPGASAVMLNRVTSANPSQIWGQLNANGQVLLVNPNGILFGKDGSVNASSFTGSTLGITDANFMAGNHQFERNGSTASVVNQGSIKTTGGYVALLGASVSNEGKIETQGGTAYLAAAETVRIPVSGSGRIKLELSPSRINAAVANAKGGSIVTEGGQVYMQAAALNSAVASILQSGSIDTTGEQGGAVHLLTDGGNIQVDGSITANSTGTDDKGQVRKGADIVIGRDEETGVLAGATNVSGAHLESRGGFVETSGDWLATYATRVQAKEWLLDPTNITIAVSGASGTAYAATYTAGADSVILASDINTSLNAGTGVTIATSATGGSAGNIAVNESISKTAGASTFLTLRAHGDITVAANKTITSSSGNLSVTLNSDFDASGAGAIVMNSGSGITSYGGNISLGGGSAGSAAGYAAGYASVLTGVSLTSSSLNAGGGNISIKGKGTTVFTNTSSMNGVNLNAASLSTSGVGTINIDGVGGNGNVSNTNVGIGMTNSATITGGTGAITLTGTATTTAGGYYNSGIWVYGNGSTVTGAGAISLTGTGGGSTYASLNQGVRLEGGRVTATGAGTVTVVGTPGAISGTAGPNAGVEISSGGYVQTNGGSISITGNSGSAGLTGVLLQSSGSTVNSSGGNITLTTDSYSGDTNATVNAGSGTVTIQNNTSTTTVNVGGTGTDTLTGTLGLDVSSAELGKITAGKIVVGRRDATGSGAVTVSALNMGAMGNTGGDLSVLSKTNIAVNDSITKTAGTEATLSLFANGNITVATNKTITASTGQLNVLLNSDSDATSGGAIVFNTGSGITSNGANITLGGGTALNGTGFAVADGVSSLQGVSLNTAAINAGGGNIVVNGKTAATNYVGSLSNISGVYMSGGSISTTGSGTINLTGNNQNTDTQSQGFVLSSGTITGGSTGAVTITGDSRGVTSSTFTYVRGALVNGTVTSTGGNIGITGYGGAGVQYDYGVDVSGSVTTTGAGAVNITGTAGAGASGGNVGVNTSGAGNISSVDGAIAITGTGGIGNGAVIRDHGVFVGGSNAIRSTGTGNITVTGTATNTDNGYSFGVAINAGGLNANSGNIKIDGTVPQNYQVADYINASITSTSGNVYIRSASANIQTTSTGNISGNNVSIDNTGGTIDANGVITKGAGGASTWNGVISQKGIDIQGAITAANNLNIYGSQTGSDTGISVGAGMTATGNLNLYGVSSGGKGIDFASGKSISSGTIQATGKTTNGAYGVLFNGTNSVTTTGSSGDSSIKGMTTAGGTNALLVWGGLNLTAATGTTLTLWGDGVSTGDRAARFDGGATTNGVVTLKGTSSNATSLMLINGAVTANANSALTLSGVTAGSGQAGVYFVNSGGVSLSNGATLNITGQNTNVSGAGTGVDLAGAGVTKAAGVTSAGTVTITGSTSSSSGSTGVNAAAGVTTDGGITIQGAVASSSNTGVNIGGAITSAGTATTIGISSNYAVTNTGSISVSGATGTGASINLSSTNAGISGTGTIGTTTNKNESVTFTQAGPSTYSGAINAANFTKAGAGALTLDSWAQTTPVATNISNAYTVKDGGSLTLATGGTYPQLNPASVNVVNASTFNLSNASNGWWKNTAFNFTGELGGGTMNLGGNAIGAPGTTNTISTSGGATNTFSGVFNANSSTVNINLISANSGTSLLDGSFSALTFSQNAQTGYGLQNGGTVNVSGGGHLLIKDKVGATVFNINAGNVQVGDGTAATASATATLDATNLSIAAGSQLTFNRAEAYSNASVITGAGSLVQAGTGIVTLTGNSNAFAGATTVNAGKTLAIGTGGSLGAAGSTLTLTDASSNLSFTNTSGTSTVASTISGLGTVKENGTGGTGVLAANNTYSGTTTVTAGTLQIGNGGATGKLGSGAVTNNAALVLNRDASSDLTVSGVISGTGTLTQAGVGKSILTGASTYTGATTVNAGTLSLGTTASTGTASQQYASSQFTIAAGATLDFNAPTGVTLDNRGTIFTGAGTLTKTGAGTLKWNVINDTTFNMLAGSLIDVKEGTFVGSTTYHGKWTNNLSSLNVAAGASFQGAEGDTRIDALTGAGSVSFGWSTYGSLTVGVNNTAVGAYNTTAGTATFSGALSGPAPLNKIGTGTQILTGTNTYSGVTTISAGTLQIGDGGTTGTLGSGAVTDNASLIFNRSNSLTVANAISGTGTLNQNGTGTTVLTATNTYSGTTTINAGTLQIGSGATTGTLGTGTVVDNGVLAFNRSDAISITQAISGTGSVLQMGSTGTTKLSSNTNTFSGGITISKGAVLIGNGGGTNGNYSLNSGSGAITLGDLNTGSSNVALQIESGTGAGQAMLTNSIVVSSSGTGTATIGSVVGSGSGTYTEVRSSLTLNRDVILNDGTTDRLGYSGTITGTGNVSITGNRISMGTPNANGISSNNFVGNLTIASGSVLQAGSKSLFPTTTNVINNGTLRLLDGNYQAINALSGTGSIETLNISGGLLTNLSIGNNNGGATFSGTITGSSPVLSLTKNGTGTQILTGANSYTGATTINAGTLQIGNGSNVGTLGVNGAVSSAVTVVASANLDFFRNDASFTIPNSISGTGVMNFRGNGVSTQSSYSLTGNNSTFAGTANVSLARLALSAANQIGSAGMTINSGASLWTNGNFTLNNPLSLSGTGWTESIGNLGALRLQNGTTYAGAITLAADARIGAYGSTGTISGVISGAKNLEFNSNTGTVTLTGNNTYSGTTAISGGTVQVGNAGTTGSLGVGDVTLSNSSNLNYVRSATTSIANNISGTGSVAATITGASSTLTVDHTINLTGGTVNLVTDGNLSVTQTINTSNATASAVFLESGKATAAGTATGGDVTLSGSGAVTVGSGGRITYMTGSVAGSTGLGVSAGNNRYKSDEVTTSYTTALGAGAYTIYREAPTLTATFNNASKTYNGLSYSGGNGLVLTGFANGETNAQLGTVTYSGTSQGAINAGDYTISGSAVSGLGYTLAYTAGTLTVNKANLVLSGTRVYDGGKTFAGQYLTATGVNSESFAVTGTGDATNLSSKHVQTNQVLSSLTGLVLGVSNGTNTGLSTNYNALSTTGSSVNVTAKAVALTAGNVSKTYDGGTTYTTTNADLSTLSSQLVSGDTVTAAGISFTNKDAGTGNKTITLSSATLSDGNSGGNYTVTLTGNATSTINKADLTLSGTRVYDASKTFAGTYLTASGVNGETFAITGAGDATNLSSKNVQANQALNSVTGLTLGTGSTGALSGNYNALSTTGSSVSVTAKAATYAATATNLTYNGTVQNQAASTKSGFVNGDALTFAGEASGTNAGTYGSSLSVSGADFSNYSITTTNANLVIGKANLTLSGTRVYDAGTTFAGNYLTATGVHGETFAVSGSGDATNLSSKNVQTGSALGSVTGLSLGTGSTGALSTNYNALGTTGSSVSVTAKSATVTGTTTNVTYNGVTQTQVAAITTGVLPGDLITVTGEAFGKNAGSYGSNLSVSASGDAGNYNFTVNNANLVIAKAALTATGNSSSVTYNGVSQSVGGFTVTGLMGTDTQADLNANIMALGASGTHAGNYANTVTAGVQTNYTVSTANGTLQIAKAALTATGNSRSVTYNGLDQTVAGFTVSGLQGTDTVNNLGSISASGATGKNAGSYTNTVSAGTETDYTVTTVNGTLAIGKAALTATGNSASLTYNGVSQSVSGFSVSGLMGSDTTSGLTSISASGASGVHVGGYTNTVSAGTETNYTVSTVNGSLQIGKANLTLSGTKVYDANTTFAGSNLTATGVNGETFALSGAGDASNLASKNVQTNQQLSSLNGLSLGSGNSIAALSTNYNGLSTTGSSVSVTPAAATVTGTLTNVTYNGTTQNQSTATSSGFIAGDVITVSGLASGKNAGSYSSNLLVGGADAGNYNVTYTNANLVVAQAPLTVTATAVTKTYNGDLNAAGNGTVGTLAGAAAGDVVNSVGAQAFLDKDAGTNKTVRASGVTIKDGNNAEMTGNYSISYVDNNTSVINKAPLTVKANDDARFVTQNDVALFNGVSYSGLVGGETSAVLGGTLGINRTNAVNDVTAQTYVGVLVPSGLTSNNYDISFVNGNYRIVPANQLLIKTTNDSVGYGVSPTYNTIAQYLLDDGINPSSLVTLSRTGTANNYTFSDGARGSVSAALKPYLGNVLAGTSGSNNTVVGTYDVKDANPTVVGGNFVGAPVFVGTLTVATKAVTPSVSGVSKVYDGTTSMNNVVVGMTGKITGDGLSIGGAGAFTQKNVGTGLGYTISNIALSGTDAGNYHLSGGATSFSGTDGAITAAPLVLTTSNLTKTYDRTTTASGTAVAASGSQLFGSDALSGGSFSFTSANAGAGSKVVTVSGVTVNDGNNGANYSVSYVNNTTSTITPKALTASYSAASKTYNGNTAASVTGSSADIIGADAVNFSNTTATFDTKNVGTGKTVTVSGIGISGADAGNYTLQSTTAATTADITAKSLTASFTSSSRAYDGGLVATVTGSSSDMVVGDALTYATTSATYDTKNVGTGKLITISGITLGGGDAGNYALQNSSASTTGAITRKDVTLSSITAANKTYDGTTVATINGGSIPTGVTGETLNVSGAGTFADKNVGTTKTVTVADVTSLTQVNGTGDWGNYNLLSTGSKTTTANITQAALTVTASVAFKTYDATLSASGAGVLGTLAGVGDAVNNVGSQVFLVKNVGTGKSVRASGVTIKDASNADMTGNYVITYVDNTGSVIRQAPLQLTTSDVTKTYDGTLSALGAAQVKTGTLFAGDSLSGGTFAFTDKNQGSGNKTVTVSGVTVGDGVNTGNYEVTYADNTTSSINKAALMVTANAVTKTYDGSLSASGSGTVGTLAGSGAGETVNVAGSQAFLDANAGTGKTVRASGVTLKDSGNADVTGNYVISYVDNTSSTINKSALTANILGPISKQYDGTTAANGLTNANFSVSGWANVGEGVTVNLTTASYASPNVSANAGTGAVSTALLASNFAAVGSTNLGNYTLPTTASGNVGTIAPAPLTVKVNDTKVFVTQDPNSAFDQGFTYTGLKNGELASVVLSPLTRTYTGTVNPAAGNHNAVYDLTTVPTAANYTVTVQKGDLTVVPADKLLLNVGSANATYGALTASNAGASTTNVTAQYCLVSTDCNGANIANLTMNNQGAGRWTATDTSSSIISFDTVVDTTGQISGAGFVNAGNYTYATSNQTVNGAINFNGTVVSGGVLTVDLKALTLNASNVTKVYDGTTALAGMPLGLTGSLSGDQVSVTSSGGTFGDKNVGSQSFSLTGLQLQGADLANYTFTSSSVTGTGTITAKTLTLSASASDKVYDGNTTASVGGLSVAGAILGDTVSATGGSASFVDKNVARDASGRVIAKSVNISGVTLTGADAANYQTDTGASVTATITPLTVNASVTAQNKGYDGTIQAQVSGTVTGTLGSDALSVISSSSTFASKNVVRDAAGRPGSQIVNVAGLTLTGADAGNYNLASTSASTTAIITPKVLNASGAVADKVYDGTAQASLTGLNGSGIVAGDVVSVQANSAVFADKNVSRDGNGNVMAKPVTVSGLLLSGSDAGNYKLSSESFTSQAKILARDLSLVVEAQDKAYDGNAAATGRVRGNNLITGDAVQISWGEGSFESKDVSRDVHGLVQPQAVSFGGVRVTGADVGNYNLIRDKADGLARITPKWLSVLGTQVADKPEDGQLNASLTMGEVTGFVDNERLTVTASGSFVTSNAGNDKPVNVRYQLQDGTNGGKAKNYDLAGQVLKANILPTGQTSLLPLIVSPTSVRIGPKRVVVLTGVSPALATDVSVGRNESQEVCSFLTPERCDCRDTSVAGVAICLLPKE